MRKTFCEVNLRNLKSNVEKIISKHNDYTYYFGVVKADCYGHGDLMKSVDIGCIYLSLAAGILYTIGAILYGVGKKKKYIHSVFHFFVLAASVLFFFAIFLYII